MDDSFYLIEGIEQDSWSIFEIILCMKNELIEGELFYFYASVFNLIPLFLRVFMEILKHIKNDSKLKLIPVIMVSMSQDQKNIDEAYQNHINAYIIKPTNYEDLMSSLRCVMALYCAK